MNKEYIDMLKQERQVLLDRYDPYTEGTGNINTAVSVLTARIKELETPNDVLKEDSVWVMVDAIFTYRMRYCVEAPKNYPEYALDDVTMETAKEFSQLGLGEQIVSHRIVSQQEALDMCDIDNDYCKEWTAGEKIRAFFTREGETRDF